MAVSLATLDRYQTGHWYLLKKIPAPGLCEACLVFAAGAGLLGDDALGQVDLLFTYFVGFLLASLSAAAMILATRSYEKTDLKEPLVLTVIADYEL